MILLEDRLSELKSKLFESYYEKKEWWGDDLSIFDDNPSYVSLPLIIRKAIAIKKVCSEMPVSIKDNELIVGSPTMASVGYGHTFPRYETLEEEKQFFKYQLNRKSVWGHHNPNYTKVLNKGLKAITDEARDFLSKVPQSETETIDWYKSVIMSLESTQILSERYVNLLREKAQKTNSNKEKKELLNIAEICSRVPMQPASSFQEALQSVWFVHIILHSTLNYTSLGRLDQYLYPYYKNDIDNNKITKSFAKELLGSFLIKFNERIQLNNEHIENHFTYGDWSQGGDLDQIHQAISKDADFNYGQTSNSWLQNCILSGITPEGNDGTNELTYLIMELMNELELTNPMVSIRLHKDSPKEVIKAAALRLSEGGAQPTIFNDDVIIPGLIGLGISEQDARDYSNDGCWETLPQGKTQAFFGHIELLLCLESLLNRGKSLLNNHSIGLNFENLAKYETFEEFFDAFKSQLKDSFNKLISNKVKYYDYTYGIAPDPLLSGILDDCIKNGKDITQKGARYIIYAPLLTGLSHCVDSLAAIKHMVYDKKMISISDLIEILRNNWDEQELLRQYAVNKIPKYGNDNDYADNICVELLETYVSYCKEWNDKIDWLTISPGVGTFENYSAMGHLCGASADGRLAQQPLSSNYSPSFGQDKEGPTSIVLSSTKFDLKKLCNGCPIDIRIEIDKENEKSIESLEAFIRAFISSGGNIITITSVSADTLKAAQKEPEKYASLRVRLGGLTAYFVQLCEQQQNEYIRRTGHGF